MDEKPITISSERRLLLIEANNVAKVNHMRRSTYARFPELLGDYVPLPAIRIATEDQGEA